MNTTPHSLPHPSAITVKTRAQTLSDGSEVFDVWVGGMRLFACSEQDASELCCKITRAIETHALNYVEWRVEEDTGEYS